MDDEEETPEGYGGNPKERSYYEFRLGHWQSPIMDLTFGGYTVQCLNYRRRILIEANDAVV